MTMEIQFLKVNPKSYENIIRKCNVNFYHCFFGQPFQNWELTVSADHKRPHRTPASPSHTWQKEQLTCRKGKAAYPGFPSKSCVCVLSPSAGTERAGQNSSLSPLSSFHTFRSVFSWFQCSSLPWPDHIIFVTSEKRSFPASLRTQRKRGTPSSHFNVC